MSVRSLSLVRGGSVVHDGSRVDRSVPVAGGAPPRWLATVAGGLATTPDVWARRIRHDPRRRFYERLVTTDAYDAWLVGWAPGQGIPAHDHGPSSGAVVVVEGTLLETSRRDGTLTTRELRAGAAPALFPARYVHAIANLGNVNATSIHVYSPALVSMRWADGEDAAAPDDDTPVLSESSHVRPVEALLVEARSRIRRLLPEEARLAAADGALLVDIRPEAYRRAEGELPGAVVVERNVLEWRLDPTSPDRIPEIVDHDTRVVLVCNEGYASSLAAAALHDLGLVHATDLDGGFRAWKRAGYPVRQP